MQTVATDEVVPKSRRVYFEVFGCQMNKLDAELMLEGMMQRGYQLVHDPAEAGVILYNTCSVRERAEERAVMRMTVSSAARWKSRT